MIQRRSLLKDKKGDFVGVLYFIASIAAFAIFLLIVRYIGVTIGEEVKDQVGSDNVLINNSFDKTISVSQTSLNTLWFIMFGGLLMGLFITAWYMKTQPVLVPVFIFLLIIAIIMASALSNAYDEIKAVTELAGGATEQATAGFFMAILPYIALIVGIIALIITYAKPGAGGGDVAQM